MLELLGFELTGIGEIILRRRHPLTDEMLPLSFRLSDFEGPKDLRIVWREWLEMGYRLGPSAAMLEDLEVAIALEREAIA